MILTFQLCKWQVAAEVVWNFVLCKALLQKQRYNPKNGLKFVM